MSQMGVASAEMTVLHAIQHWIHGLPVPFVAWSCTIVAAAMAIFIGMPRAFRRVTVKGNRAGKRILLLLVVLIVGVGIDALIDHGYRLHVGQAHASTTLSQTGRTILASHPFQIQQYYAFQSNVASDHRVLGSIPELTSSAVSWTDLNTHQTAPMTVTGLPIDLSPTFYAGRPVSKELAHLVTSWHKKLGSLTQAHVYANGAAAKALGIRRDDELAARVGDENQFLTVSGVLPHGDVEFSSPALFMTLPDAQSFYGLPNQVSASLVFFEGGTNRADRGVEQTLLSRGDLLGTIHLTKPTGAFTSFHSSEEAIDATRRLAAIGLALVVLACLFLLVLGRRSLTARARP